MLIQETLRIIEAFETRYLILNLDGGPDAEYTKINAFVDPVDHLIKVDFTLYEYGEYVYTLRAWFDDATQEEFHIMCTDTNISCVNFAEEFNLTPDNIHYLKFGTHL